MLPEDFTPEMMRQAQEILKHYNQIYPSEMNRKLFPEMIQAIQHCSVWNFSVEEIIQALDRSISHPFWSDVLSQGSLTGFLKPRHIETLRHYTPESEDDLEKKRRQQDRWEAKDAKQKERNARKGLDENGQPILRVAVQS